MIDTPESRKEPVAASRSVVGSPDYRDDRYDRRNRLSQVLAWVGIVAGIVFVVAVIFFSGFWIGKVSGHNYGWHRGNYNSRYTPGQMSPGMMGPGMMSPGMMGPGQMAPGQMGPGQMAPGQMGPGQMGPGGMGPGGMGPGGMTTTPTTARP